jgi:hypothetical protein
MFQGGWRKIVDAPWGRWVVVLAGIVGASVLMSLFVLSIKIKTRSADTLLAAGQLAVASVVGLATLGLLFFTGRYVTLTQSLLEENKAQRGAAEEAALRRDLDETRRLGYMALLSGTTGHVEIAASLVNALVHHQGVDVDEAMAHVPTAVNGGVAATESAHWLREKMQVITATLEQPRARH